MIGWIVAGAVLLVIVVVLLWLVAGYNRLVMLRESVRAAWAQIDVLLKRRYDLIPNLVETVKGYAKHESQTLEAVIAARNAGMGARNAEQASVAESQMRGALGRLFAVAEAYPELKANANFSQLQTELTDTENQISSQRSGYNNTVQSYNTTVLSFPLNIVAGILGFTPQSFFEVQDAATREAPKVSF